MTSDHTAPRRVVLRVREGTPTPVLETVEDVVARLRRLEDDGAIADSRVETWCGPRSPALLEDDTIDVIERYLSWADEAGCSLEPAFGRREVSSMVSGRSYTELVVPFVTLAVYEGDPDDGDALDCVAPCVEGDDVVTVEDCLRALEAGADDPLESALEWDRVDPEAAELQVHPA